jgi:hypothetical protein
MITVVTTFSQKNYNEYARNMVETFHQHWPDGINLAAYTDVSVSAWVDVRQFDDWFPVWHAAQTSEDSCGLDLKRNRPGRVYDFRRDCKRFSFKVAAFTSAARVMDSGWLVWMDADIMTFRGVEHDWLVRTINPAPSWMCWIDRVKPYPECCFMVWDMASENSHRFMNDLRETYRSGRVYDMKETHDSYVIQQVIKNGRYPPPSPLHNKVSFQKHHAFPYTELGRKMDHLKGDSRKKLGRSIERRA